MYILRRGGLKWEMRLLWLVSPGMAYGNTFYTRSLRRTRALKEEGGRSVRPLYSVLA